MTAPLLATDEDVRRWFAGWCSAWAIPLVKDLAANRPPSRRRDELKSATQHSMYALTQAYQMPPISNFHRERLMDELDRLYRLLVARPRNSQAIDYQVWQVAYRWADLATTGGMSDDWVSTEPDSDEVYP